MIRADEAPAPPLPASPRLRTARQARGNQPSRPEPLTRSGEPVFIYREPGPPGVPGGLAQDPDVPYGPDDPAYGPPSPEWYARGKQDGLERTAGELEHARGPFEPARYQDGSGQELAAYQPPAAVEDDPIGGGTSALDQIKDFYLTAEAIGPENLDRHVEELLERQRQLISDYFKEAGLQETPR